MISPFYTQDGLIHRHIKNTNVKKALFKGYFSRLKERGNALYFNLGYNIPELYEDNNRYLYAMLKTPKSLKK